MTDIESQQDYYDDIGFSERLGFGQQPAVLVIDMCRGITEPGKMFIDMEEHIPHINAINEAARRIGAPVISFRLTAAPPRASPSIFVRITPDNSSFWWKLFAD